MFSYPDGGAVVVALMERRTYGRYSEKRFESCAGALLKQRSPQVEINVVIREIALDLAEGRYRIDFQEHIAGTLNTVADILSRVYQPGFSTALPAVVSRRPRAAPPARTVAWWEAAGEPSNE